LVAEPGYGSASFPAAAAEQQQEKGMALGNTRKPENERKLGKMLIII
jgi:hypothetical protein